MAKKVTTLSKGTPSLGNLALTGNLYKAPSGSPYKTPTPLAPAATAPIAKNYTQMAAPAYQESFAKNVGAIAGGGGFASPGAVSGGGAVAPAAPIKRFSENSSDEEIADVDGTFRDQKTNYADGLRKFMADLEYRKTSLERDTKFAKEGLGKNRESGMVGVGEDYAARGLGHSGLFVKAKGDAETAYNRQESAVDNALADGKNELEFSRQKEEANHTAKVQAARRDALYRLQLNNNLTS